MIDSISTGNHEQGRYAYDLNLIDIIASDFKDSGNVDVKLLGVKLIHLTKGLRDLERNALCNKIGSRVIRKNVIELDKTISAIDKAKDRIIDAMIKEVS
jgi:hypothetical protein